MLMNAKIGKITNLLRLQEAQIMQPSEDEALDLALRNNKGIVEIILDNEYEESDCEETSHMMESNFVSLGELQEEEFVVDNDHVEVK